MPRWGGRCCGADCPGPGGREASQAFGSPPGPSSCEPALLILQSPDTDCTDTQGPRMTVTISPIGHSLMKSSRPSTRRVTRTVSSVRSISRATVASTSLPCSRRATTSPIWSRWTGNSMAARPIVVLGGRWGTGPTKRLGDGEPEA
jgi:hypothetical protein